MKTPVNCFVDDSVQKIELNDGLWVEVKSKMSYDTFKMIFKDANKEDNLEMAMPLLLETLKAWNFTNSKEEVVPCTKENIANLDVYLVLELINKIMPIYSPEKKSSIESEAVLSEGITEAKVQKK